MSFCMVFYFFFNVRNRNSRSRYIMLLWLRRPFFRGRNLPTLQIIVSRIVGTHILYLYVYNIIVIPAVKNRFSPIRFFLRWTYIIFNTEIAFSHSGKFDSIVLHQAPLLQVFIVVLIILATTRLCIKHLFYGTTEQICRRVS